jgi:hypothetical protein
VRFLFPLCWIAKIQPRNTAIIGPFGLNLHEHARITTIHLLFNFVEDLLSCVKLFVLFPCGAFASSLFCWCIVCSKYPER